VGSGGLVGNTCWPGVKVGGGVMLGCGMAADGGVALGWAMAPGWAVALGCAVALGWAVALGIGVALGCAVAVGMGVALGSGGCSPAPAEVSVGAAVTLGRGIAVSSGAVVSAGVGEAGCAVAQLMGVDPAVGSGFSSGERLHPANTVRAQATPTTPAIHLVRYWLIKFPTPAHARVPDDNEGIVA